MALGAALPHPQVGTVHPMAGDSQPGTPVPAKPKEKLADILTPSRASSHPAELLLELVLPPNPKPMEPPAPWPGCDVTHAPPSPAPSASGSNGTGKAQKAEAMATNLAQGSPPSAPPQILLQDPELAG